MIKRLLYGLGILVVLGGCSSTNEAITHGRFQKRKLRSGWHINVNSGNHWRAKRVRDTGISGVDRVPARVSAISGPIQPGHILRHKDVDVKVPERVMARSSRRAGMEEAPPSLVADVSPWSLATLRDVRWNGTPEPVMPDQSENSGESGRTNGMALAGFILSFVVPLLGLIFSVIGLGQVRSRGDRGLGFAIAGTVISVIGIALFIILP